MLAPNVPPDPGCGRKLSSLINSPHKIRKRPTARMNRHEALCGSVLPYAVAVLIGEDRRNRQRGVDEREMDVPVTIRRGSAGSFSLDPWIDSVLRRGDQLKVPFGQGGSGLSRP